VSPVSRRAPGRRSLRGAVAPPDDDRPPGAAKAVRCAEHGVRPVRGAGAVGAGRRTLADDVDEKVPRRNSAMSKLRPGEVAATVFLTVVRASVQVLPATRL